MEEQFDRTGCAARKGAALRFRRAGQEEISHRRHRHAGPRPTCGSLASRTCACDRRLGGATAQPASALRREAAPGRRRPRSPARISPSRPAIERLNGQRPIDNTRANCPRPASSGVPPELRRNLSARNCSSGTGQPGWRLADKDGRLFVINFDVEIAVQAWCWRLPARNLAEAGESRWMALARYKEETRRSRPLHGHQHRGCSRAEQQLYPRFGASAGKEPVLSGHQPVIDEILEVIVNSRKSLAAGARLRDRPAPPGSRWPRQAIFRQASPPLPATSTTLGSAMLTA